MEFDIADNIDKKCLYFVHFLQRLLCRIFLYYRWAIILDDTFLMDWCVLRKDVYGERIRVSIRFRANNKKEKNI